VQRDKNRDIKTDVRQDRLIRMPPEIWVLLDEDAERCGRSATKQIEVILKTYYGLGNTGLNEQALAAARRAISEPMGMPAMGLKASERAYLNSTGGTARASKKRERKVRLDVQDVISDARARAQRKRQNSK
jgi:isopropylmalate/homocitrate/citramalate synthase